MPEPNLHGAPYLTFSPIVAGHTYTPQFNTNLVGGTWLTLTNTYGPFTNGSQVSVGDTNLTSTASLPHQYFVSVSSPA